jgi:stage V sporulation protein R
MATQPGRLNPYKLGIELLRDVEERWNTGQFGPEYEECDDYENAPNWDTGGGLGRQKIFEVRTDHYDVTFIDTFLTPDSAGGTRCSASSTTTSRSCTRSRAASSRRSRSDPVRADRNFGQPIIRVKDGNYRTGRSSTCSRNTFGST